jgi:hypothetical protein
MEYRRWPVASAIDGRGQPLAMRWLGKKWSASLL